jgi:hypothetical protein
MAAPASVSPNDYLKMLEVLKQIHQEAGIMQPNCPAGSEGERLYEKLKVGSEILRREVADQAPRELGKLVEKVSSYAHNLLFVYEAARRINSPRLAKRALSQWKLLFLSEADTIAGSSEPFPRILPLFKDSPPIEEIFKNQSAAGLMILMNEMQEMEGAFVGNLIQESKQKVMEAGLKELSAPGVQPLFSRMAHLYTQIDLTGKDVDDSAVQNVLSRCQNLVRLVLTDCRKVTHRAFRVGHLGLRVLILDRTRVHPDQLRVYPFDKNLKIQNSNRLRAMSFSEESDQLTSDDGSWARLEASLKEAEFVEPPSEQTVRAMLNVAKDRFSFVKFSVLNSLNRDAWPLELKYFYIRLMIQFCADPKTKDLPSAEVRKIKTVLLQFEAEKLLISYFKTFLDQFKEGSIVPAQFNKVVADFKQLGFGPTNQAINESLPKV